MLKHIKSKLQLHVLINELDLKQGVEIGTQYGLFAKYLLDNTNLHLTVVDCWQHQPGWFDASNSENSLQEKIYRECIKLLTPYQTTSRVDIIRGYSVPASLMFPVGYFDFIFLDANHTYPAVSEDLVYWYPKLKVGGLFSGHDYKESLSDHNSEFGVKSALRDFLKGKKEVLDTNEGEEAWPCWWFIKEEQNGK